MNPAWYRRSTRPLQVAFLFSLLTTPVLASDQEIYFHLHQAYEFLEAQQQGRCGSTARQVQFHLKEADGLLGKSLIQNPGNSPSPFESALHQLWSLMNQGQRAQIAEIERVRLEVQVLADAFKQNHLPSWHDEIERCAERT